VVMRSADRTNDWQIKQEAIRTWTNNPCGAVYVEHPVGSKEFFEAMRYFRYSRGCPYLLKEVDFANYKNKKLLEIGCGLGIDLVSFARAGAIVTGVDLTPRSIELCHEQFQIYGLEARFLVADAENLPFPDENFDVVYSFGVLHHTPNIQKAISEIHRVLKPKGEALVMVYNKNSAFYLLSRHFGWHLFIKATK